MGGWEQEQQQLCHPSCTHHGYLHAQPCQSPAFEQVQASRCPNRRTCSSSHTRQLSRTCMG